ncbi:hypothetical protein JW964_28965 [candidate division KSB1 bacterium]|nr:hypothetical protein [candidate division KSB1 bacterium]
MDTFVNPLPGMTIDKWLGFDYPVGIWTRKCHGNINLLHSREKPTTGALFDKLGYPRRDQGYPCMYEFWPEDEDPWRHDQIVDIDRKACFDHTGRLSGSFVKILTHFPNHVSRVTMHAVPLTNGGGGISLFDTGLISLTPGSNGPNQWYWYNAQTEQELIFTAHAEIDVKDWTAKGMTPGIYNLIIKWEFWDRSSQNAKRLPISGFDESMTFELSAPTSNF